MNVYIMSNHVSERMSIVRRESMADIPLKDRIGSVSWRVAEDCRKEEAWRRVWQRRKRGGGELLTDGCFTPVNFRGSSRAAECKTPTPFE